jgi:hypothetical protein
MKRILERDIVEPSWNSESYSTGFSQRLMSALVWRSRRLLEFVEPRFRESVVRREDELLQVHFICIVILIGSFWRSCR